MLLVKNLIFASVMLLANIAHAKSSQRLDTVIYDTVDLIEVNHFYTTDLTGETRITAEQIIFYEWSSQLKMFLIIDWRLLRDSNLKPMVRYRDGVRFYTYTFHDEGYMRVVTAPSRSVTYTLEDPEVMQREILPQEQRKELTPIGGR